MVKGILIRKDHLRNYSRSENIDRLIGTKSKVHLLPVKISKDGPARVSTYFKVRSCPLTGSVVQKQGSGFWEDKSEKSSVMTPNSADQLVYASFRGRDLIGKSTRLGPNWSGVVITKKRLVSDEGNDFANEDEGKWISRASFDSFTVWGHDSVPDQQDPLFKSLDWLKVSSLLHPCTRKKCN